MKILVTGGSGFIGSRLIPLLIEKGHEVRVLARKSSNLNHLNTFKFERINGDVNDEKSLYDAVKNCEIIYHLAGAITAGTEKDYIHANRNGTENLMKAVLHSNPELKNFIFVSSLAAGGPTSDPSHPRSEEDPDQPVSFYGMSKKKAEEMLTPYFSKIPITIIRPPMVYGERDKATLILAKTAKNKFIPLVHGTQKRSKIYSIIHVDDLAEALLKLIKPFQSGEIFYVNGPHHVTGEELMIGYANALGKNPVLIKIYPFLLKWIAHLMTLIGKWTGHTFMLNNDKVKEITEDFWLCESDKIKQKTGFQPRVNFKIGVEKTVKWYKENHWL